MPAHCMPAAQHKLRHSCLPKHYCLFLQPWQAVTALHMRSQLRMCEQHKAHLHDHLPGSHSHSVCGAALDEPAGRAEAWQGHSSSAGRCRHGKVVHNRALQQPGVKVYLSTFMRCWRLLRCTSVLPCVYITVAAAIMYARDNHGAASHPAYTSNPLAMLPLGQQFGLCAPTCFPSIGSLFDICQTLHQQCSGRVAGGAAAVSPALMQCCSP